MFLTFGKKCTNLIFSTHFFFSTETKNKTKNQYLYIKFPFSATFLLESPQPRYLWKCA